MLQPAEGIGARATLFAAQLLALGVIGEYLARLHFRTMPPRLRGARGLRLKTDGRLTDRALGAAQVAAAALMLALLVDLLRQLVTARSDIEGVDFFYYVLNARDALDGVPDGRGTRFIYFPGVYVFWQAAMWLSGRSIDSLQWWYAGVLVLNAVLVAFIIGSTTRSRLAGLIGAAWYLDLVFTFEGLAGATEPIATLPLLAALAVWVGLPPRAKLSWGGVTAYCCGIGLAVFVKQQAALLVPGILGFVVARRVDRRSSVTIRQLAALGAGSAAVFTIAMLAQGRGLLPFRRSIGFVTVYGRTGSLIDNLRLNVEPAPLLFVGIGLSIGLLAFMAWTHSGLLQGAELGVFCFCLLGGVSSLAQFSARPYRHYLLLGLPMLVCAVLIGAAALARSIGLRVREPAAASALLAVCVAAFGWALTMGPRASDTRPPELLWRQNKQVARDLRAMSSYLDPGDDVLVLPARRNEIHFELGTVSTAWPLGYAAWHKPGRLAPVVASPQLDGVIIVAPAFRDSTDTEVCVEVNCDDAPAILSAARFTVSAQLESMTLWQPSRASGAE